MKLIKNVSWRLQGPVGEIKNEWITAVVTSVFGSLLHPASVELINLLLSVNTDHFLFHLSYSCTTRSLTASGVVLKGADNTTSSVVKHLKLNKIQMIIESCATDGLCYSFRMIILLPSCQLVGCYFWLILLVNECSYLLPFDLVM